VSVHLEQAGKMISVRLQGSIDISSAEELKKVLVNALKTGEEIRLWLGEATYLDVTGVQLLCAAEREAHKAGVRWIFVDSLPEPILTTLHDAGFEGSLFAESSPQSAGEAA
jgi:anti-anti-sigma factor